MAGIYIHIPFCKQACSYCDFHFSTNLSYKKEMIDSILKEIELAKDFIEEPIETIYFGGGTPSLLTSGEINNIIDQIHRHFNVQTLKEVTLEANPDDLNYEYLKSLRSTLVHRLSIGIQSFQLEDLSLMNRAHTAKEAEYAIKLAQDTGFEKLSCDLIFGTPSLSYEQLKSNIYRLAQYEVDHISAYALTIEERTALAHQIKKGTFKPSPDAHYVAQMQLCMDELASLGYEQYEISNYARKESFAVHNTNYWKRVPYLGIGPSAHSFNGTVRRWNVRNNALYIQAILKGEIPYEIETLSSRDQFNEYVMMSLRTKWGISSEYIASVIGNDYLGYLNSAIQQFLYDESIREYDDHYYLTNKGKLLADAISSELFMVDNS